MITHYVKPETAKFYEDALSRTTMIEGYGKLAVIDKIEIRLFDDYEVEISLVNGDESSGPYLDAVLFDDGMEVQTLPPSFTKLVGTYNFHDSHEWRSCQLEIKAD